MEIQEDELSVMRSCRDFGLGVMKLHHFRGFSACVLLKVALKDAQCPHLGWVEQDRDPLEGSVPVGISPEEATKLLRGLEKLSCEDSRESWGCCPWNVLFLTTMVLTRFFLIFRGNTLK